MQFKKFRQKLNWHAAFTGVWTLLLAQAILLYEGNLLHLALGGAIFYPQKGTSNGWIALLVGESIGVATASTLLVGPNSPLALLLIWPIAWAALNLPWKLGLLPVTSGALIYLVMGLTHDYGPGEFVRAILAIALYLATFYGTFGLVHTLVGNLQAVTPTPPPGTEAPAAAEGPQKKAPQELPPVGPEETATAPTAEAASEEDSDRTAGATAAVAESAPAKTATSNGPAQEQSASPETDAHYLRSGEDPLYQDLRMARDIQVSLLLASTPRPPGWEVSTSFLPARELGGDLYDFIEIDEQHRGIMIGDVTGKGIPAALHMAVARTLFRMEAGRHIHPGEALTQLNRFLIEQVPQGCVTMLYASLDIAKGSMILSNAGHIYPILLDGSVREIALAGLPLGIDDEYTYNEIDTHLKPGDALIFYTDGIVEAVNGQEEFFGYERLHDLLANGKTRRPRTLTRQIVRAVRNFTGGTPQSDDITLVVLRRRYSTPTEEMVAVTQDVLGLEAGDFVQKQLDQLALPADAPKESWRAAILTLGSAVRDKWGQGQSRELMQQLFLSLEGF
jgi:sigma-B regulation protein RsbU (phosphoserine phosphatase)